MNSKRTKDARAKEDAQRLLDRCVEDLRAVDSTMMVACFNCGIFVPEGICPDCLTGEEECTK